MLVERLAITLFKWFADLILDIFTLDLPEGLFVFTPLLFVPLGKIWIPGILEFLIHRACCVLWSFSAFRLNQGGWSYRLIFTVSFGTESSIASLKVVEEISHIFSTSFIGERLTHVTLI